MHVIIVGCGRVGASLARRLSGNGHDVVVIDKEEAAFRRLGDDYSGRTVVGIGFDRDVLTAAGVKPESLVAAVTNGDNSNIVIARVARELFGCERVVARIYDPLRAAVYERLGIRTVASVRWTVERMHGYLVPAEQVVEWTDATAAVSMIEHVVTQDQAGQTVEQFDDDRVRIAVITRNGVAFIPTTGTKLQQDDRLHVAVVQGIDSAALRAKGASK